MKPLAAQSPKFWQEDFKATPDIVDSIYNLILEAGQPQSIDEVGILIVRRIIDQQRQAQHAASTPGRLYRPQEVYAMGDKITFPQYNYVSGEVIAIRPGFNPIEGDFSILEIRFDTPNAPILEMVANLQSYHLLAEQSGLSDASDNTVSVQQIYGENRTIIRRKLETALKKHGELIAVDHLWYLAGLLTDIQEGLLNIVDAAIDIHAAPLNVDSLIEQMDLQSTGSVTQVLRFSVNYKLSQDDRFINVGGSEGRALWYLRRLMGSELTTPPLRLEEAQSSFKSDLLTPEMRQYLADIADIDTPVNYLAPPDPNLDTVQFALSYPYWRSGTLPLLPAIEPFLPPSDKELLYISLVDGQSGTTFPAWVVQDFGYLAGLKNWLTQYQIPVGGFVSLSRTADPYQLVVNFEAKRQEQEWIRAVFVEGNRLAFRMQKKAIACAYDELMLIDDPNPQALDTLYTTIQRSNLNLLTLLKQIFPELMKLTSQSAVHVRTLYSAVNLVKRVSPGPIFQLLVTEKNFTDIGHGYWTYTNS